MKNDDFIFDLDEVNSDIQGSIARMGLTDELVPNEEKLEVQEEEAEEEKLQLNLDIFDKNKLEQMTDDELIDSAAATILKIKEVDFATIDMVHLASQMHTKPKFELIQNEIEIDERKDQLRVRIPVFDESEAPHYRIDAIRDGRYDAMPQRRFFFKATAEYHPSPLGLISFDMLIAPLVRVTNDIRHNQISLRDKNLKAEAQLHFYFDYQQNKFIKVYSDKLKEARDKIEKHPELLNQDDNDSKQKIHPNVKEYLLREITLERIMTVANEKSLPYLAELKKWRLDTYTKGGIMTNETLTSYLDNYETFLNKHMTLILKIKLIFQTVSVNEYNKLIEKKKELLSLIEKAREYPNDSIFRKLNQFKEIRPPEKPVKEILGEDDVMVGYIGYCLERNEMYPTIVQLEARMGNSVNKEDINSETEFIKFALDVIREEKKKQ